MDRVIRLYKIAYERGCNISLWNIAKIYYDAGNSKLYKKYCLMYIAKTKSENCAKDIIDFFTYEQIDID